jgi:hypothetical protein
MVVPGPALWVELQPATKTIKIKIKLHFTLFSLAYFMCSGILDWYGTAPTRQGSSKLRNFIRFQEIP